MRIIGTIGANGSGKDEVLRHLAAHHGVPFLSTGDMVRAIAAEEGVEPTRESLGVLSERRFAEQGAGCFVRMAAERIVDNGWPVAGISGIRSVDDVRILKEAYSDGFVLIHVVVSDPRVRFERMARRGEARDPKDDAAYRSLDAQEEARFHLSQAIEYADVVLHNDGTLEDLHRAVDRLVRDTDLLSRSPV